MHRYHRIGSRTSALCALVFVMQALPVGAGTTAVDGTRYSGVHGLRVDFAGTSPAFVEDATPEAERRHVVRFYLRNTRLQMAHGDAFVLFAGYPTGDCSGSRQLEVKIVRRNPDFRLRVGAREDGGGVVDTTGGEATLALGWRAVEIDWTAASGEGAGDGAVRVWVDGNQVAGLDGLDNDLARIDCVRWGAVAGVDAGTSGSINLDDFDSRRVGPIGVLSAFADVPTGHAFFRAIHAVYNSEVTSGCGGDEYCPRGGVTRGQMAAFVLAAKEGPTYTPPPCTARPFDDVPTSSLFCPWIQELADREITSGCGGGDYCPGAGVTRGQMAVFLLAAADEGFEPPPCTTRPFDDVPTSSPFCGWIREFAERGITSGCGGGDYCPSDANTRGQMAVFLQKAFELPLPRQP